MDEMKGELVLSAGHGFANSVTWKKPRDKSFGVFGVHQFLLT
jgi:hypothetical protein